MKGTMRKPKAKRSLMATSGADDHRAPESNDTSVSPGESGIGEAIQSVRLERGLTLSDLAQLSGVSVATLSKIENGRSGASFDTVYRVATSLGMGLDKILQQPSSQRFALGRRTISRAGEELSFGFSSYFYRVPCADLVNKGMLPLIMTIKTRNLLPRNEWASHVGEEYIYVIEGEIEFHTEFYLPAKLRAGDSAYIDSQMQHAFVNVGEGDARMLSVCLSGSLEEILGEEIPSSLKE